MYVKVADLRHFSCEFSSAAGRRTGAENRDFCAIYGVLLTTCAALTSISWEILGKLSNAKAPGTDICSQFVCVLRTAA